MSTLFCCISQPTKREGGRLSLVQVTDFMGGVPYIAEQCKLWGDWEPQQTSQFLMGWYFLAFTVSCGLVQRVIFTIS